MIILHHQCLDLLWPWLFIKSVSEFGLLLSTHAQQGFCQMDVWEVPRIFGEKFASLDLLHDKSKEMWWHSEAVTLLSTKKNYLSFRHIRQIGQHECQTSFLFVLCLDSMATTSSGHESASSQQPAAEDALMPPNWQAVGSVRRRETKRFNRGQPQFVLIDQL